MGIELKVVSIGESLGVVLPKEILARLGLGEGDTLHLLDTQNGVELRCNQPDFARQFELAEEVMSESRDVLKRLSK